MWHKDKLLNLSLQANALMMKPGVKLKWSMINKKTAEDQWESEKWGINNGI